MKIEPVIIDENGGATKQVQELRNLYQRDNVDVVLGYISSGDCLAVAPIAEELKKMLVLMDPSLDAASGQQTALTRQLDQKVNDRLRTHAHLDVLPFAQQSLEALEVGDVMQGIAKSGVFAVLIALIGCATGFSVKGGAEGVGHATTRAVVISISALLVADMVFPYFLNR